MTLTLQQAIAYYTRQGWHIQSRDEISAQLFKPKHFSFGWALVWLLFLGIGLIFYLIWHAAKKDKVLFLEAIDGQVEVNEPTTWPEMFVTPLTAWLDYAKTRETLQGKILAYAVPIIAALLLLAWANESRTLGIVALVLVAFVAVWCLGATLMQRDEDKRQEVERRLGRTNH